MLSLKLSLEYSFAIAPYGTVDLCAPLIMFENIRKTDLWDFRNFACCTLQIFQCACGILQYEQH